MSTRLASVTFNQTEDFAGDGWERTGCTDEHAEIMLNEEWGIITVTIRSGRTEGKVTQFPISSCRRWEPSKAAPKADQKGATSFDGHAEKRK